MIYLDSSVVLAHLFAEDRLPPKEFERANLVSSRLLQYEVWNRIHARGFIESHSDETRTLLDRIDFIELTPQALARAFEPLPIAVRTLDAIHLATIEYLREHGQAIELATYDGRLAKAALAMGIRVWEL